MKRWLALVVSLFACSSERSGVAQVATQRPAVTDGGIPDPGPSSGEADAGTADARQALIDTYLSALRFQHERGAECEFALTAGFPALRVFWPGVDAVPPGLEGALQAGDAVLDPDLVQSCVEVLLAAPSCWGESAHGWSDVPDCAS